MAASLVPAAPSRSTSLLNNSGLDAVVIATPVPTHAALTRRCLEAGKHVLVEKPLAQSAAEADEVVGAAREHGRTLMVGHLLEYHPGVDRPKSLVDSGELGQIHYIYGNRLNLGKLRSDENALWSLGAHDVWVVLRLVGEEPTECQAFGECCIQDGSRTWCSASCAPLQRGRSPAPVLARPAQGAALHGRGLEANGDFRRHGPGAQGHPPPLPPCSGTRSCGTAWVPPRSKRRAQPTRGAPT